MFKFESVSVIKIVDASDVLIRRMSAKGLLMNLKKDEKRERLKGSRKICGNCEGASAEQNAFLATKKKIHIFTCVP